jgi:peptide/nickel transport system ATP-binding protein
MSAYLLAGSVSFAYSRRAPDVLTDVTLRIERGESVALVGESGSGKTTLARLLLGTLTGARGTLVRPSVQTGIPVAKVFQDIHGSMDPRLTAERTIAEALPSHRRDRRQVVLEQLEAVGLSKEFAGRYPHQLSGGQCQRVCIARALASGADVLILDEPTSALDAHVRLQVLELLNRLRRERDLTYLVISHDFQVVRALCDRVAVMCEGTVVEHGDAETVMSAPQHPYTRTLLAASELSGRSARAAG